jgi:hypothetical protein
MKKAIRMFLFFLIFLLSIPCVVYAYGNDLSSSNLIILEDKKIEKSNSENVTVVMGNADITTDINGSVIVVFGKATIDGNVSGDVVSAFGEVYINGDSKINGNLVSVGKLERSENVEIKGTKLTIKVDLISLFKSNGILINTLILYSLITLIAGLILICIFTARYRTISYNMNSNIPRRLALGGLVVISATIVLAFLIFMIIIPAIYVLLLMFADIIAGIYLGTVIFRNNYERSAIYLEFFVGHLIISILKIVPLILIPGGAYTALLVYGICFIILEVAIACFGIGTVIDTSFGKNP